MSEIERRGLQTIYETPYTCTYCGDHIASGWAFCPECGTATGQGAAELDREKNEPPKCYECKNESDSWECERCIWGDKSDRYEPKGEEV